MRFWVVIVFLLGLLPMVVLGADTRGVMGVEEAVGATVGTQRSVGTAGGQAGADFFAGQLAAATGQRVFRQRFTLAVPLLDKAEARIGDKAFAIYPLLPAGGQIASLKDGAVEAEVVYAGHGSLEEVRGKVVAGRWVALEMESGDAWKRLADVGAAGVLYLSSGGAAATDFLDKSTHVPMGLPRFYTQDGALVEGVRSGAIAKLTLTCRAHWEEREVENLLVLIPARHAVGRAAAEDDPLFVLSARYDGTSQVLGLSPGATQAANAAGVVQLAQKIAAAPDHAAVLVVLTGGDEWLLAGTRHLQDMLLPQLKDGDRAVAELQRRMEGAGKEAASVREMAEGVRAFAAAGGAMPSGRAAWVTAVRDELDRRATERDDRLQAARLAGDEGAVRRLAEEKRLLVAAGAALGRGDGLTAEGVPVAVEAARGITEKWMTAAATAERRRAGLEQEVAFRRALGNRPLMYHFGLELTTGAGAAARFGLFDRSFYLASDDLASHLGEVDRMVRRIADGLGKPNRFVPETMATLPTMEAWLAMPRAFSTDISLASGMPGGTFATVQDAGTLMDTPGDTMAAFNAESFNAQFNQVAQLLLGDRGHPGALTDPDFRVRVALPAGTDSQVIRVVERGMGDSTPRLGRAGALIGAWQERTTASKLIPAMQGTRAFDFEMTGIDGNAAFTGLMKTYYPLQAFTFQADGSVDRALAQSQESQSGLESIFTPDSGHPLRAMLFEARRLDLFALFDPRYGQYLDHLTLLDARRREAVGTSALFVHDGVAAIFFPPRTRWQLLASRGDLGNRMILIHATAGDPEGDGFESTEAAEIGPLAWRAAHDFSLLDQKRKAELENRGISSEIIKELHASAERELAAADEAKGRLDYGAWLSRSAAAWSLESQAYTNLISTSNGIIYGVIFLLLAIIPFAYFLERLLFGFTNVYRQIGAFAGIFAVMAGGLWFHPAFRISAAPVMILLAFFILILSSLVVFLLFGKFEEEIARLRGASASVHSASLRRAAVLGAAIRLGLSNMRRRGMRTAMTLTTLVLLTFTLLCFTSLRETLGLVPQVIATGGHGTPGILLRQRGWREMPPEMAALARAEAGPGGAVAQRWWLASESPETMLMLPLRASAAAVNARDVMTAAGLLGLEADEGRFHAGEMEKVLPGWGRLAAGENVCLLPTSALAGGAVRVNDEVLLLGHPLVVAGFFNPNGLDEFRQMTGDSMMPVNPTSTTETVASNKPEAARSEAGYSYLDPRQVAIVPIGVVRALGGRLASVVLRPVDEGQTVALAQRLARESALSVVVAAPGAQGQVRSYDAAAVAVPANLDRVLVPMILAGIIVLNTMLGAVAERSREIHVYTSLGLAPSHVATLFLAEAAALGTLGVVFGYIFGQGLATVLSALHVLQGVDLNYSSTGALFTVSLVMGTVMLSALWPARVASRIAAPSLQREWKLPRPVGDLLQVELPFTVNADAAGGICAFLEEHFASTTQTGQGRFTTDAVKTFTQVTRAFGVQALAYSEGDMLQAKACTPNVGVTPIRGFHCRVWLAPYDLGVIQQFWLAIHPTDDRHVFEVHLTLIREAGSPGAWLRLNRAFLTEVRKQFLLWRGLEGEAMQEYVMASAKLFAHAEEGLPPARF